MEESKNKFLGDAEKYTYEDDIIGWTKYLKQDWKGNPVSVNSDVCPIEFNGTWSQSYAHLLRSPSVLFCFTIYIFTIFLSSLSPPGGRDILNRTYSKGNMDWIASQGACLADACAVKHVYANRRGAGLTQALALTQVCLQNLQVSYSCAEFGQIVLCSLSPR